MTDVIDGIEPSDETFLSDDDNADSTNERTEAAEAEAAEGEEQPEPKPKKTAQDRINEVTAARREAERERDYWRNAAISGQPAPNNRAAPEHPRDAPPQPEAFVYGESDPGYVVALAKYEAKREIRQEYEARDQVQRQTANLSTFDQKVAEQFPDGEPEGLASLRTLPAIRSEITDVIFTSDKGPQIAAHLGDNPSALRRLEGLPAHMVGFELAKIEASFAAPPPPKRVTSAPDPAPKARGGGGQFSVSPDTTDFAAFERLAAKAT